MSNMKYAKLMCVDHKANCNKIYEMEQVSSTEFKTTYGREGGHMTVRHRPMSEWDKVYRDKTRPTKKPEPYRDVTHLHAEEMVPQQSEVSGISDAAVAALVNRLQAFANKSISVNYRVSSSAVTQAMVEEAQSILDEAANLLPNLVDMATVNMINRLLIDLYHVIPRKMDKVANYVLPTDRLDDKYARRVIHREQDNLDVMAQQVGANARVADSGDKSDANILDAMGVSISPAPLSEIKTVRNYAGSYSNQVKKVFQVKNNRTQERFEDFLKSTRDQDMRLFWHGSRNENWLSIIDKGLLIRPTGVATTGDMFGRGIYFASEFSKSFNYTSVRGSYYAQGRQNAGFMAMFWVYLGNILRFNRHDYDCYRLDFDELKRRGDFDSVHGAKGRDLLNDEYIIYKPDQCTIAFLAEIGG